MSLPGPKTTTPFGRAWIDRSNYVFVGHAVFPVTRQNTSTRTHPLLPPGFTVALQLAYLTPTGVALSTPSLVRPNQPALHRTRKRSMESSLILSGTGRTHQALRQ